MAFRLELWLRRRHHHPLSPHSLQPGPNNQKGRSGVCRISKAARPTPLVETTRTMSTIKNTSRVGTSLAWRYKSQVRERGIVFSVFSRRPEGNSRFPA